MSTVAALVSAFILPQRRARYLNLLESQRGSTKFCNSLAHFKDFDPRFMVRIPADEQTPQGIAALLREYGAPAQCTVISERQDINNATLSLLDALTELVGYGMGSIVSCVEGRLAYYEGEERGCRFILYRPVREPPT